MKPELIKKHKIGVFLNGGTSEAPDWVRIKKATEFTRSMNPETEERDYIADEHPTTELMDYKPSEDLTVTTYKGERTLSFCTNSTKSAQLEKKQKGSF
ncbi:MAG: hypothetical protein L6V86_06325 [Treponema sp.]|nr:MAG: hypothetical protein L6V86_06325 [Treponema sp.]